MKLEELSDLFDEGIPVKLIRLSKSVVGPEEAAEVSRVIELGYLGMGQEVKLFEDELKSFIGGDRDVLCVSTGTSAIHLALQALGIGPGDEVLVPSLTYLATFQAISATGAKPTACDVSIKNGFIDVVDAQKRITSKTKAIVPVHYGSSSQGIEDVYIFAKKNGLRVVEDAAHSFGCIHAGQRIGSTGDIICFSFDGIKNITSGEGGAVVTGDREVSAKIKDARLLGVEKDTDKRFNGERSWLFDVHYQGWRYHMSNIMAAIGRAQLKKIGKYGSIRREIALQYVDRLRNLSGLELLQISYENLIPHIFPVRILSGKRQIVSQLLKEAGVETGIHYQPNHLLSFYKSTYSLPISEQLGGELLSLPLHPDVTESDQLRICTLLEKILKA
ncbi:DegT/DnrJ/EryC1/StrS family aminotransferase [Polynucleobacter antarcticus]|uniref:DegT/DnrJ/EryC1/StrS family aminotransferase n=1 Tax=Polynucleobacter antarcticus TaxID=1743162 RepID=UPI0020C64D72|nr:DegT/DnrJ/EryC1/StrS family aminotransferase [Polynucleobacter antarcticus]